MVLQFTITAAVPLKNAWSIVATSASPFHT
jgi:hypothetical protein